VRIETAVRVPNGYRWRLVGVHRYRAGQEMPICIEGRGCVNAQLACEAEGGRMLRAAGSATLSLGTTMIGASISGGVGLLAGARTVMKFAKLAKSIKDHHQCVQNENDEPSED